MIKNNKKTFYIRLLLSVFIIIIAVIFSILSAGEPLTEFNPVPKIYYKDSEISINQELNILDIVSARNALGEDISKDINIFCDVEFYDNKTGKFKADTAGTYTLTLSVSGSGIENDVYEVTEKMLINVKGESDEKKYVINILNSQYGKISLEKYMYNSGENVMLNILPVEGFLYNGLTYIKEKDSSIYELNSDKTSFKMPNDNITIIPKWIKKIKTP